MSDTNFLVTLVLMVVMPATLVTCVVVFRQVYTPDKILAQVAKKVGYARDYETDGPRDRSVATALPGRGSRSLDEFSRLEPPLAS